MYSGIYIITNKLNGKSFIGQSSNIYDKFKRIKREYPNEKSTSLLYEAMRVHGFENFECRVLEKCALYLLNYKEKYYIEKYNTYAPNGYNKTLGGRGY